MTNHEVGEWHGEVITASTEATLRQLSDGRLLDRFYLAGGTGLALRVGHRRSLDLDFFAPELFDEEIFLQRVQSLAGFSLLARAPHSLHTTVQETKVSFLGCDYPLLFPQARFLDVSLADQRDIACMKMTAIASRGMKRDFVPRGEAARPGNVVVEAIGRPRPLAGHYPVKPRKPGTASYVWQINGGKHSHIGNNHFRDGMFSRGDLTDYGTRGGSNKLCLSKMRFCSIITA